MAKYYSGITTGTTLDSMLASGSEFGIFPSQDIDCQDISTSGIAHFTGGIKDTSGDMGNSGQVLSSTGSGLNWINPGDANVASASNVGTNDASSTNATHYLAFLGSTSGNNPVRIDTSLTYNPSTNLLGVGGTSGGIVPSRAIIMWSGAANEIPPGYVLCDGNNNTPDLRNKFVVGASSSGNTTYPGLSVDAEGGSADSVVVTHNHGVSDSGHDHNLLYNHGSFGGSSGAVTPRSGNTPVTPGISGRISSESTGISINDEGVSGTNKNLPPYYALCYIMKT